MRDAPRWVIFVFFLFACTRAGAGARPAKGSAASAPQRLSRPTPSKSVERTAASAARSHSDEVEVATAPPVVGLDWGFQAQIDRAVLEAVADGRLPGAVVTIGRRDRILFQRAYGYRALTPSREAMTVDTIFDIASLTKPLVTATAIMVLVERGELKLDDPIADHLPAFGARGKHAVTVRQLLTHTGGLPVVVSLAHFDRGREYAWQTLMSLPLEHVPGTRFSYSDIGYIVLGRLVEEVTGQSLDAFAASQIFEPLGMRETSYGTKGRPLGRVAPTERTEHRDEALIRGEVHDPRAYRLGGVAGNAGVFSTAADLSRYAQMMLGQGSRGGVRLLRESTVDVMTAPQALSGAVRALGWDVRSGYSRHRGEGLSSKAFGHGGYTGTSIWIDPEQDLFVLFLSNRVHPDGEGDAISVAGEVATIAVRAVAELPAWARGAPDRVPVLTGIDVLREDGFSSLRGKRVGLITNASGRTRSGLRTLDVLAGAGELELVAIFAPEHGLAARQEGRIRDGREARADVPVYSLFGKSRRPAPEQLSSLDALVFDIQDVGSRFYTYMSTMRAAMEAASERGIPFFVLDRPNPINGVAVEGPLVEPQYTSFVNYHPLPIRHGMTAGELARLLNAERSIGVTLEVVPMRGWRRELFYNETDLPWYPPSPNIQSLRQALLYSGVALLEGTNVSVGRGGPFSFEVLGAPWLHGDEFVRRLNARRLPGVHFEAIRFVPKAGPYKNRTCRGARIGLDDPARFEAVPLALALAVELRHLHRSQWKVDRLPKMWANEELVDGILNGKSVEALTTLWKDELEAFVERRAQYLLYP